MEDLYCFDVPVLLGTSRKSVIGLTLDLPVTEREEGPEDGENTFEYEYVTYEKI